MSELCAFPSLSEEFCWFDQHTAELGLSESLTKSFGFPQKFSQKTVSKPVILRCLFIYFAKWHHISFVCKACMNNVKQQEWNRAKHQHEAHMEAINTSKCLELQMCSSYEHLIKKRAILNVLKTLGLNGQTVSERTVNCCFKAAPY